MGVTTALRALQEPSRLPQERSKSPEDGPKSAPRALETAPRALQEPSRRPRERSKRLQHKSGVLRETSTQPQERSKRGYDGSKRCSGQHEAIHGPFAACSKLLENLSSVIEAAGHHSRWACRKAFEEAVRFHSARVDKLQINWLRA